MLKKGTPASPATARASRVLPVPGAPSKQNTLGDFASELLELPGVPQKFNDFLQFGLCLVYPGHIIESYADLFFSVNLHLRLADREHSLRAASHAPHEKTPEKEKYSQRQQPGNQHSQPLVIGRAAEFYPLRFEIFHEIGVFDPEGGDGPVGLFGIFQSSRDSVGTDDYGLDLPGP